MFLKQKLPCPPTSIKTLLKIKAPAVVSIIDNLRRLSLGLLFFSLPSLAILTNPNLRDPAFMALSQSRSSIDQLLIRLDQLQETSDQHEETKQMTAGWAQLLKLEFAVSDHLQSYLGHTTDSEELIEHLKAQRKRAQPFLEKASSVSGADLAPPVVYVTQEFFKSLSETLPETVLSSLPNYVTKKLPTSKQLTRLRRGRSESEILRDTIRLYTPNRNKEKLLNKTGEELPFRSMAEPNSPQILGTLDEENEALTETIEQHLIYCGESLRNFLEQYDYAMKIYKEFPNEYKIWWSTNIEKTLKLAETLPRVFMDASPEALRDYLEEVRVVSRDSLKLHFYLNFNYKRQFSDGIPAAALQGFNFVHRYNRDFVKKTVPLILHSMDILAQRDLAYKNGDDKAVLDQNYELMRIIREIYTHTTAFWVLLRELTYRFQLKSHGSILMPTGRQWT